MNLHNDTETFKAAIQETSDYFEIRNYLIEKDYWITFVLSQLEKSTFVKSVVFKGGTSLSKAFRLIDRFSFDKNPVQGVAGKIRHFYDLHYLMQDEDCLSFVNKKSFKNDFKALLEHDKAIFDDPEGWKTKNYQDSPILIDFDTLWGSLKVVYASELKIMAFKEIPHENNVKDSFKTLIDKLKES